MSTHVVRSSSGSMWSPQGVQTLSGPVVGNHQTHFKVSQRQTKIRSCLTSLQSEASDAQQHLTFIWFLMIHYRELCILGKISSFLSLFQNGDSSKQITAYESFPFCAYNLILDWSSSFDSLCAQIVSHCHFVSLAKCKTICFPFSSLEHINPFLLAVVAPSQSCEKISTFHDSAACGTTISSNNLK